MQGADHQQQTSRAFGRRVILLVGLGFLALIVAGASAVWVQLRNQSHIELVEHTHGVVTQISTFGTLNERVETARRGYLIAGDDRFRQTFEQASAQLPQALQTVGAATADNPRQQAHIVALLPVLEKQRALQRRSIERVRSGDRVLATADFYTDEGAELTREIRAAVRNMLGEENRLLAIRDKQQRGSLRTFYVVLAIAGVILVVVAILTIGIILRYMRDLNASRASLRKLNENLEGAVKERTTDLQRANDEIQRFAYIVSHDLRSPLVNVMGFTSELDAARKPLVELVDRVEASHPELLTEEARLAAREDLPEAVGFIRSSTQKMDRLINAILRLSREGRRAISPEQVDVRALLQNTADSVQHRVGELGAEIRIDPDVPGIYTDRLALEQIFSNLIENAVKYLKPGRPGIISVTGRRERGRIVYEVADNGRGIDPKDHDRIFDLFRRSGAQDQPGEGIGLAHVRALAYRLGGVIDCESALDQGATFRLSLPQKFQAAQGALT